MPDSLPVSFPSCYPVWQHVRSADPHMAAIRHIRRTCINEPEREARLIGSVFHQMQSQMLSASREARHEDTAR